MECTDRMAWLGAALVVALGASVGLADDTVGDLGDRRLIEVQGAELFDATRLAPEVFRDLAVLKASHPAAPLKEYEAALRKSALRRLNFYGFPDATVEVFLHPAESRVVVELDEGVQYTCGPVKVLGAEKCQADWIVKHLTEGAAGSKATQAAFTQRRGQSGLRWLDDEGKSVNDEGPAWLAGQPPRWDQDRRDRLAKRATTALADHGYRDARCDATLELDKERCEAVLVVHIHREGEPTRIRHVEVTGNEKNSRDEVLEYLELKPGGLLTRDELTRIQRKLWDSARFKKYTVAADEPVIERQATLRITLVEYAEAPKLKDPLSDEEAALLKCRKWLFEFEDRREDMHVTVGGGEWIADLVISPENGWLLEQRRVVNGKPEKTPQRTLYLAKDTMTLVEWDAKQRLTIPLQSSLQIIASINMVPLLEPGKTMNLSSGFGWKFSSDPHDPFDLKILIHPMVVLSLAHEKDAKCSYEFGNLNIERSDGLHMRVNPQTGQLLLCELNSDEEGVAKLSFESGVYAARRADDDRRATKFTNMYRPERPLSSLLAFLCEDEFVAEILNRRGQSPRSVQVMQKLFDGRVLEPLDDFVKADNEVLADLFVEDANAPPAGGLTTMGWRALLSFNDQLFARRTWPWTLCREGTSLLLGDMQYLTKDLAYVHDSNDTGPIGFWVWCELSRRLNPKIAQVLAARGLTRLSDESFHHEWEVLLARPSIARDLILNLAGVLKKMDDEEVEILSRLLMASAGPRLLEVSRGLRQYPDKSTAEALQQVLDESWQKQWREPVRQRLNELTK